VKKIVSDQNHSYTTSLEEIKNLNKEWNAFLDDVCTRL